ncbi:MAG: helix-turn-helix domain-containing protein [Treponema sp.]|jgi:hypothetical protein|nr:helix-turn-helix domain-containing protein [Treponema sp.]
MKNCIPKGPKKYSRLTIEEREDIAILSHLRMPLSHIAEKLERDKSIISQENRTIQEQLAGRTLDKTQFDRIMEKLGISIPAHTPQAQGRSERLWVPFRTRLPVSTILRALVPRVDNPGR